MLEGKIRVYVGEKHTLFGTFAALFGLLSLMPFVGLFTGPIAIIMGITDRIRNKSRLGNITVLLGFVGIISTVVIYGSLFYFLINSADKLMNPPDPFRQNITMYKDIPTRSIPNGGRLTKETALGKLLDMPMVRWSIVYENQSAEKAPSEVHLIVVFDDNTDLISYNNYTNLNRNEAEGPYILAALLDQYPQAGMYYAEYIKERTCIHMNGDWHTPVFVSTYWAPREVIQRFKDGELGRDAYAGLVQSNAVLNWKVSCEPNYLED